MSNKIQKPGQLPNEVLREQPRHHRRVHRSPGWIKAREERSERRANDPAVQARAHGQATKAAALEESRRKQKETQDAIDKLIRDQKADTKKTKWEKN